MEAEAKVRNWIERRRLNKAAVQHSDDGFKPQINFVEHTDSHEPANSLEPADSLEPVDSLEPADLPEPTDSLDPTELLEHANSPEPPGTPIAQLEHRLGLIKPTR
jgi:hypothetical protein